MKPDRRESMVSEGRVFGQLMHKHRGRSRGVTMRQLAAEINGGEQSPALEREIRRLVVDMRKKGIPVCACPSQGYYLAQNDEEVEEVCRHLHQRAMTSLQQIAALRRIALPDLIGQLGFDDGSAA